MSWLLYTALQAYPRELREREGDVIFDLARELVDGGSPVRREALGLVVDGVRARAARRGLGAAPWRPALLRAGMALATLFLALVVAGALGGMRELAWPGWWWATGVASALAALGGVAFGRRGPALLGGLALLALCLLDLRNGSRATVDFFVVRADGLGNAMVPGGTRIGFAALGACTVAAVIVVAAALACDGRTERMGAAGVAWAIAAAAGLVVAAGMLADPMWPFTDSAADPGSGARVSGGAVVLAGGLFTGLGALVAGARDRAVRLAATLVLAGLATPIVLSVEPWVPRPDGYGFTALTLLALAACTVASLGALARSTAR